MTQSQKAEETAANRAGELLWNVSLLPVSRPREPAATSALVIELPIDLTSRDAIRRRNAA